MEEALRAMLLADGTISSVVGGRVDWGEGMQGADLPAIVMQVVSSENQHSMQGPDGLFQSRVQIDAYAQNYGAAKRLQRAVLAALDGYHGGPMQGVFHAGSREGREAGTNEAERPYRVSMDFMTNWSE
ncbi:DUF3168 domain-containing protein [Paracoccus sp. Z330]|uniref:DUF3168 domain-containing protein n=1 Tax=Paracoccus onchidii TaxID=3017813 RepID=A0ABT4ZF31_9RHOB|nr:DUF3168 domain-containing protein [Paracoccus onchidii]MDB6177935.1 DUF3168 domain-containing protein [Paracoccus onchidii]